MEVAAGDGVVQSAIAPLLRGNGIKATQQAAKQHRTAAAAVLDIVSEISIDGIIGRMLVSIYYYCCCFCTVSDRRLPSHPLAKYVRRRVKQGKSCAVKGAR